MGGVCYQCQLAANVAVFARRSLAELVHSQMRIAQASSLRLSSLSLFMLPSACSETSFKND